MNGLFKKKWAKIALFAAVAVALTVAVLFAAGVFNRSVMVSFNSLGGSEITSQTVEKGTALAQTDSPVRNGYKFTGWYYDEGLRSQYDAADTFKSDTELFAGYISTTEVSYALRFLANCEPNVTFKIKTTVELTDENFGAYVQFSDIGLSGAEISFVKQGDVYVISAKGGFTEGFTYKIVLADREKTWFVEAAGEDVLKEYAYGYSFSIYKENYAKITYNNPIKFVSRRETSNFIAAGTYGTGDSSTDIYGVYLSYIDENIKVGDILGLGYNSLEAKDTIYFKVINADVRTESDRNVTYLELVSPTFEEVYDEVDIYFGGDADLSSLQKNETDIEKGISAQLSEKDGGYSHLLAIVADEVKNCDSVKAAIGNLDAQQREEFMALPAEELFEEPPIVSFTVYEATPIFEATDNGCKARITIDSGNVSINLRNKDGEQTVKITMRLVLQQEIKVGTYTRYLKIAKRPETYERSGAFITSDFTMNFSGYITTPDGDDPVDIADELQNMCENATDIAETFANGLNEDGFMSDDLDYDEVLRKTLGTVSFDVYGFTFEIKLDAVLSIGMRAGMAVNVSYSTLTNVGYVNGYLETDSSGTVTKVHLYGFLQYKLFRDTLYSEFEYSITFKGQIGVRAGLEVRFTVAPLHLNEAVNVGLTAQVGVYAEITAYVNIYGRTMVMNGWGDHSTDSAFRITGGIDLETGVYVEVKFIATFLKSSNSLTLYEQKFPLFSIGSNEVVVGFKDQKMDVTFDTPSYNAADRSITAYQNVIMKGPGGAIVTEAVGKASDYSYTLLPSAVGGKRDLDYVSLDENGMITIKDGAPDRVDFTVKVRYLKAESFFSDGGDITKTVNFTYKKYAGMSDDKVTAEFYGFDGVLLREAKYYVGQRPVQPASGIEVPTGKYQIDYANLWVDADGGLLPVDSIYKDTKYYLNYSLIMYPVELVGRIYSEDGSYKDGVLDTLYVSFGEDVSLPKDGKQGEYSPSYLEFLGWSGPESYITIMNDLSGKSSYWEYTPKYVAVYKDTRSVITFCFGSRVLTQLVEQGKLPVLPDISGYTVRTGMVFAGWSPEIVPAAGNAVYIAGFKDAAATAKFFDMYGRLISEQQVDPGALPKEPAVNEVEDSGEGYYEYVFKGWNKTITAAKAGETAEYHAIYARRYRSVTTAFDPGSYTLDGGAKTSYTGTYDPNNVEYFKVPDITVATNSQVTSVDYWRATEMVNGDYPTVKPGSYYSYMYDLTFVPVMKTEQINYSVKFFLQGETGIQLSLDNLKYGSIITADMLSELNKASDEFYDYTLRFWSFSLPYTVGSRLDENGKPDTDTTVTYAHTAAYREYSVIFNANGGQFAEGAATVPVTGTAFTDLITYPAQNPTRDGYTFLGYNILSTAEEAVDYTESQYTKDGLVLYAVWLPPEVTVTLDANGGMFGAPEDVTCTLTGRAGRALVIDFMPERAGMTFVGWGESADAQQPVSLESAVYAEKTYYAIWHEPAITVTFDAGIGYYDYNNEWVHSVKIKVDSGETVTFDVPPVNYGTKDEVFTFTGYDADFRSGVTVFTGDVTYTAQYSSLDRNYYAKFATDVYYLLDGELKLVPDGTELIFFEDGKSGVKTYWGLHDDLIDVAAPTVSIMVDGVKYTTSTWYGYVDSFAVSQYSPYAEHCHWNITSVEVLLDSEPRTFFPYTANTVGYGLSAFSAYDAETGLYDFSFTPEDSLAVIFMPVFTTTP